MILGTAGHIDHGKTTLIRALTGIDTDRLPAEKERGISIDLGFAHIDFGEQRCGIVDVPGHERFIRNMVAGAHGMDLVLLVVAADDGVMPQTVEHAEIARLLGVRAAVIALTKVDLATVARRAAVREEIAALLAGTVLADSPVVEVSVVTGEGIEKLRSVLGERVCAVAGARRAGCFRLPVDRAFVLRGHGLVVTGTAISGTVAAGTMLRLLPSGAMVRVRSVQRHGRVVSCAGAGERVALNLAGVGHDRVRRGQVVCDPVIETVSDRLDVAMELCRHLDRPAARRMLVRLHLGTGEVLGTLTWIDGGRGASAGQRACAQLLLRAPVCACVGDRFIVRDQQAQITVGGGIVLDPEAPSLDAARLPLLEALSVAGTPEERLPLLLALGSGWVMTAERLASAAGVPIAAVHGAFAGAEEVRPLPLSGDPVVYSSASRWGAFVRAARAQVAAFHESAPHQPGMEMESFRSRVAAEIPASTFRLLVDELSREGVLVRTGSMIRLPEHGVRLTVAEEAVIDRALAVLEEAGFTPPRLGDLARRVRAPPDFRDLLARIENEGRIVRVAADLWYATPVVDRCRELIRRHIREHGAITAAALRDEIGASRKFSIALLNYFDRTGFTRRVGDERKLRRGIIGERST